MTAPGMKRCPSCATTLPLASFDRDRRTPSGRSGFCKSCRRRKALVARGAATPRPEPIEGAAPPMIYGPRHCNRCDEKYVGRGRLLCDSCLVDVEEVATMAEGVSA